MWAFDQMNNPIADGLPKHIVRDKWNTRVEGLPLIRYILAKTFYTYRFIARVNVQASDGVGKASGSTSWALWLHTQY